MHKHVVADFHVLSAVASGRAIVRAFGLAGIYKHFGIRTARTGYAGGSPPIVLFVAIENVIFGDTLRFPIRRAFLIPGAILVTRKNGYCKFVLVEFKMVEQEIVGASNCVFLEIIAERPSSEHLEEGAMSCVADFVDITGTHADLNIR